MSCDDKFSELIQSLYTTALTSEGWSDWTAQATLQLGGIATGFTVFNRANSEIACQILHHPDAKALERYMAEEIWRLDPQMPVLGSLDQLTVYTDLDHLNRADPATRSYLDWQTSNSRMGHYLSVATPLSSELVAGFSVHRALSDGPVPDDLRAQLTEIAPHLRHALELGFVHTQMLDQAYWDGLLTQRNDPSLLLDERSRLICANPAATSLLNASSGLRLTGQGQLVASDQHSDVTLQAVIAAAILPRATIAGTARIVRRDMGPPMVVTVYPLARRQRALAPFEAAALVRIVDPTHRAPQRQLIWQQAFRFTPRENELAAALASGHSLESAAESLQISYNTARVHLRSIFAKTDCVRQSDLIRLLTQLN